MPRYRYSAVDRQGNTIRGTLRASDDDALGRALEARGLRCTDARRLGQQTSEFPSLTSNQLADFCRELGALLAAGLPLAQALAVMADNRALRPRIRTVYEALLAALRRGEALSDAMQQCAPAFPPLLITVIRTTEGSGRTDRACRRMADYFAREHKVNQQIGNSLLYPFLLVLLLIAVLVALEGFVLPQFKPLFEQLDALPPLTTALFAVSDFTAECWPLLLLAPALLFSVFRILLAYPLPHRLWDRFLLALPLAGRTNRKVCTARFARTLSDLYAGGVPAVTALTAACDSAGNAYISAQLDAALETMHGGSRLSEAVAQIDGFDPTLAATIAVGEQTGQLDELLRSISESLEADAETATRRMLTLLEPLLILLMGLIVGSVMLAILLPIYQSYSAIGSL